MWQLAELGFCKEAVIVERKMVTAEISVIPLGTGSTALSKYVALCLETLEDHKNIKYLLTPTCTIVQGELDQVFDVVREMHEVPFKNGVFRVITSLKIDDRRDKELSLEERVRAVEEKLK